MTRKRHFIDLTSEPYPGSFDSNDIDPGQERSKRPAPNTAFTRPTAAGSLDVPTLAAQFPPSDPLDRKNLIILPPVERNDLNGAELDGSALRKAKSPAELSQFELEEQQRQRFQKLTSGSDIAVNVAKTDGLFEAQGSLWEANLVSLLESSRRQKKKTNKKPGTPAPTASSSNVQQNAPQENVRAAEDAPLKPGSDLALVKHVPAGYVPYKPLLYTVNVVDFGEPAINSRCIPWEMHGEVFTTDLIQSIHFQPTEVLTDQHLYDIIAYGPIVCHEILDFHSTSLPANVNSTSASASAVAFAMACSNLKQLSIVGSPLLENDALNACLHVLDELEYLDLSGSFKHASKRTTDMISVELLGEDPELCPKLQKLVLRNYPTITAEVAKMVTAQRPGLELEIGLAMVSPTSARGRVFYGGHEVT